MPPFIQCLTPIDSLRLLARCSACLPVFYNCRDEELVSGRDRCTLRRQNSTRTHRRKAWPRSWRLSKRCQGGYWRERFRHFAWKGLMVSLWCISFLIWRWTHLAHGFSTSYLSYATICAVQHKNNASWHDLSTVYFVHLNYSALIMQCWKDDTYAHQKKLACRIRCSS